MDETGREYELCLANEMHWNEELPVSYAWKQPDFTAELVEPSIKRMGWHLEPKDYWIL